MPGDHGGGVMIVDTCRAGFLGRLWRSWELELREELRLCSFRLNLRAVPGSYSYRSGIGEGAWGGTVQK